MPACLDRQEWPPFICGLPSSFEGKTIIVIITTEALQHVQPGVRDILLLVKDNTSTIMCPCTPPFWQRSHPKTSTQPPATQPLPHIFRHCWVWGGASDTWRTLHVVVLTGATIWVICSTVFFMVSVVSYRTMKSRGLAAIMRLTVW